MTIEKLIKAVLKYMDGRGMLETVKKNNSPPAGQKPGRSSGKKPPQQ